MGVTGGYRPPTTAPRPAIESATEPVPSEILPPEGSVSGQPPRSINAATAGIGLASPHRATVIAPRRGDENSAYPYPTRSQPSVIVSQRCACGARRAHEAVDHHQRRPDATFVCAICATRIARVA